MLENARNLIVSLEVYLNVVGPLRDYHTGIPMLEQAVSAFRSKLEEGSEDEVLASAFIAVEIYKGLHEDVRRLLAPHHG